MNAQPLMNEWVNVSLINGQITSDVFKIFTSTTKYTVNFLKNSLFEGNKFYGKSITFDWLPFRMNSDRDEVMLSRLTREFFRKQFTIFLETYLVFYSYYYKLTTMIQLQNNWRILYSQSHGSDEIAQKVSQSHWKFALSPDSKISKIIEQLIFIVR